MDNNVRVSSKSPTAIDVSTATLVCRIRFKWCRLVLFSVVENRTKRAPRFPIQRVHVNKNCLPQPLVISKSYPRSLVIYSSSVSPICSAFNAFWSIFVAFYRPSTSAQIIIAFSTATRKSFYWDTISGLNFLIFFTVPEKSKNSPARYSIHSNYEFNVNLIKKKKVYFEFRKFEDIKKV